MNTTIDKSRFASTIAVTRYRKSELDENGRPHRWGARQFKSNQIVLETDEFIFVSHRPVAEGSALPRLVTVDPQWSLIEQYATSHTARRGDSLESRGLLQSTLSSDTLERVLQVACDMGRWDIAFMIILRVYRLNALTPAGVIWDRFPHHSQMRVVSDGRLLVPGGLAKTVIERWWAWQGGYHCPTALLHTDFDEYERFMNGIRNPFNLVGVSEDVVISELNIDLPVGVIPPALTAGELGNREWFWGAGVAYLANAQGKVLPYWYVSDRGDVPEVEQLAWSVETRTNVARSMNLPILIARRSSQSFDF